MKTLQKISLGIALLALLVGCQKEEQTLGAGNYPADGVVRISTQVNNLLTRAEGTTDYEGTSLSLSAEATNSRYTYSDIEWTNGATEWTPATQMLWESATQPVNIYAYAPYVADVTDITAVPVGVAEDQTAGLVASDLVGFVAEGYQPYNNNAKQALEITFDHIFSKLTLTLTLGDELDASVTVSSVKLLHLNTEAAYNAKTRALSDLATEAPIEMQSLGEGQYTAILLPQTVAAGRSIVEVALSNGKSYRYAAPTGGYAFATGTAYAMNLKVGKDKIEIADGGVTVVEWDDNNGAGYEIPGGAAHTLCIDYNNTKQVLEIATASGLNILRCMRGYAPTEAELDAANLTQAEYNAMYASARATNFNAVLTSDIDLSEYESWKSIGQVAYKGVFDGQGYRISGLKSDYTTDSSNSLNYIGLFGYADGATFRNLTIVAPTMVARGQGGALVGDAKACTISNCTAVDVDITGMQNIGGLIGVMSGECLVENCYGSGTITGNGQSMSNIGGLIGIATGTVQRCGSTVGISAPQMQQIGGLCGQAYACRLVACYAKGDVEGNMMVGGLVGSMSGAVNITGCYVSGNITGNYYKGAITGNCPGGTTANVTGFYYSGTPNTIYLVGQAYGTAVMKIKYCAGKCRGLFDFNTSSMKENDESLFFGNLVNTSITFAQIRAAVASTEAQSIWAGIEPDASYVEYANVRYNLSGDDTTTDSFWLDSTDDSLKFKWE